MNHPAQADEAKGMHFSPFYLLSNLRVMTGRKFERQPNLELASRLFAVGSTTARDLCLEAGIDPNGLEVRKFSPALPGGSR